MKTIGLYLREVRKQKGMSVKALSAETKIRRDFIRAIEREQWEKLPREYSVVTGFVKSIAGVISMDREQAVALLRRDYPPKMRGRVDNMPKPDVQREFRIGPQLVFFLGVAVIVFGILAYLFFQYRAFVEPPTLVVDIPAEQEIVRDRRVLVSGKTSANSSVTVNSQPALVDAEGNFSTTVEITATTGTLEIVATSRAGKETRVTRTIRPELSN